jgi:hypothetical protein
LPRKAKELDKPYAIKYWRPITAIASVLILLSGLAVVANQQYVQGQQKAIAAAEEALELGEQRIEEVSARLDDLELAINNSEQIVVDSEGQTLEDKERDDLLAEIEKGKETWVEQKSNLLELAEAVRALRVQLASGAPAGSTLASLVIKVADTSKSNWDQIATQISALGGKITSVQTAQATFQKEMQKLEEEKAAAQAAEAAERLAREQTIASTSTLTDTGGSTAPTAPAPPPPSEEILVAPVEEGETNRSFITSYIAALASNSFIEWVPNLCDGFYVCGRAWVGGTNTDPVLIELDPALEEIYINSVGLSVLVHEAAHARQWLKYGPLLLSSNAGYLGLPEGYTEEQAKAAVEYMADCATIVKLGYSTNVYTTSCTQDQLNAAATIW